MPSVVFLHGWCGQPDELESWRTVLPERLLAPAWMPAPGSLDPADWPGAAGAAMDGAMLRFADTLLEQVRSAILAAGFEGSLLIGHSMGGAMAVLLAADPALAATGLVMLDSSVPMPPQRRSESTERMGRWLELVQTQGLEEAQRAWAASMPERTRPYFHAHDRGPLRKRVERRMAQAPVLEAAAALGGAVQWDVDAALQAVRCPILALAADPARLPVEAFQAARPDAQLVHRAGCGHFLHLFDPAFVSETLTTWLCKTCLLSAP